MQEDIGEKTKSSLFWNTSLPLIYQIFRFAISIVIARLLNPKDFGIMGIASIIIFYTNSLSDFGFSASLIQRKEINEKHINSVFTINLFISIFLLLITCSLSKYLANFFNVPELKNTLIALSIIFITTSFNVIPAALLRRDLEFKILSLIQFSNSIIQTISTLIMALLGFGYWSLIFGLVIANIISTIFINLKVKCVPRFKYSHNSVKEIFNFSIWNFLLSQITIVNDYIDKFIIGKFWGPVFLGYYDKAFSLTFMPVESISNKISVVMFSSFSRNKDNVYKLKEHFIKSISIISLICFPIFIGLAVIAPYFVIVLLGDKWKPMTVLLQILSLAFIFNSLIGIISALNIGAGNYRKHIRKRIYCLIFMMASCLFFVRWGIDIVAIVILVSNILFFVLSFNLAKQILSISWSSFIAAIIPALSGSVIMFIFVKLLSFFMFLEINMINLILSTIIGAATYIIFIFIIDFKQTRFLREELRNKTIKIRQKFEGLY